MTTSLAGGSACTHVDLALVYLYIIYIIIMNGMDHTLQLQNLPLADLWLQLIENVVHDREGTGNTARTLPERFHKLLSFLEGC